MIWTRDMHFMLLFYRNKKEDLANEISSSTPDIHVAYTWRIAILRKVTDFIR